MKRKEFALATVQQLWVNLPLSVEIHSSLIKKEELHPLVRASSCIQVPTVSAGIMDPSFIRLLTEAL